MMNRLVVAMDGSHVLSRLGLYSTRFVNAKLGPDGDWPRNGDWRWRLGFLILLLYFFDDARLYTLYTVQSMSFLSSLFSILRIYP